MAANILSSKNSVFVDLTQEAKSAQIVRRGFEVPAVKVDPKLTEQLIGNFTVVDPGSLPRVVSQSIATGTKVAAGTAVDLVLAPRSGIPFDIFQNLHVSFKGKTMDQVDPIVNNADARKILLTFQNPQDVPDAEKTTLTNILKQNNVQIDDQRTDTSFNAAFETMRNAMAFQE